jgi:hypothetical protein
MATAYRADNSVNNMMDLRMQAGEERARPRVPERVAATPGGSCP